VLDRLRAHRRRPVRRTVAVSLSLALLVVGVSGCTSDDDEPKPAADPTPTRGSTAVMEPKPAPVEVRVTRVAGRMKQKDQDVLADKVGSVVSTYFDDAFLGGDYPRSSFGDAFGTFTAGAAQQARRDQGLLTNRRLAPTTESVTALRQTAYLAVLAPHRTAAGVTAKVHLRYLVDRGDRSDRAVTVKGRLLLTRTDDGGWKIFGYDLTQSATPVGEGS
jgi:hypothetical protein